MNDKAVSKWFRIDEFRFHLGKWMANWRTQVHWTYFHCLFHFVYILHFNDSLCINLNLYGWAGLCFSFRYLKIDRSNQIDWRSEAFFVICLEIDGQMEIVFVSFFEKVSFFSSNYLEFALHPERYYHKNVFIQLVCATFWSKFSLCVCGSLSM